MDDKQKQLLQLIARARQGEQASIAMLYGHLVARLGGYLEAKLKRLGVRPPYDSKNACHEVATEFILHLQNIQNYESLPSVLTYLRRCIQSVAENYRCEE